MVTTEKIIGLQAAEEDYIPLEVVDDPDLMPIIEEALEDLSGTYGTGYLKIRVGTFATRYSPYPPTIRYHCASVCIPFSYQKKL